MRKVFSKIGLMLAITFLTMTMVGCGPKTAPGTGGESRLDKPAMTETVQATPEVKPIVNKSLPEEKPKSPIVTFVELGSVNCVPCKMMQPVMDAIEKEYSDQVQVVFHDVWTKKGRPYGKKYQIRAIPTQIFLDSNGKEFHRHTGFYPKEEIDKVLKKQGVK